MSSVAKTVLLSFLGLLSLLSSDVDAKDLHVLVLGDRLAANCHAVAYAPVSGVVVLGSDGQERPAADPLIGADCNAGSVWMPLAARLKRQPGIDKVVLIPVAVDGLKAEDWGADTTAARRLAAAVAVIQARGAKIDYALWQQGLADSNTSIGVYQTHMRMTMKHTSLAIPIDKWLIATVGNCEGRQLQHLREAQRLLAKQAVLSRFAGPSTDLPSEGLAGGCTLSARGQEMMAQRWFDAIQRSDILSRRYRTETLIQFFK